MYMWLNIPDKRTIHSKYFKVLSHTALSSKRSGRNLNIDNYFEVKPSLHMILMVRDGSATPSVKWSVIGTSHRSHMDTFIPGVCGSLWHVLWTKGQYIQNTLGRFSAVRAIKVLSPSALSSERRGRNINIK